MMPGERSRWLLLVVPVSYVLLLCGPALLGGSGLVLGSIGGDLASEFVGLREFGFGEEGISAKYFSIIFLVCATSMSPATTRVALLGP